MDVLRDGRSLGLQTAGANPAPLSKRTVEDVDTFRTYPRTLREAFPDSDWRTGIEHFKRPSHGLGFGKVFALVVIGLLMVGIARAIR